MKPRARLWWTALLLLIALFGAGLAVAADRPQYPQERPDGDIGAANAAPNELRGEVE